MFDDPSLLVVDDEETICEGCRRIFSRQGFRVEKTGDACEGLRLAAERDYSAILLDIKMPKMDGLEFLEAFRARKPHTPVILITGYPSVPNAASAIRLGASDYVTKPFSPEEITQAVRRSLLRGQSAEADQRGFAPAVMEPWDARSEAFRFFDESWLELGNDRSVRAGVMLTPSERSGAGSVVLPRIDDEVFQGLPLASLNVEGKPPRIIPSPVSGTVIDVNGALQEDSSAFWADPLGNGWIARIAPSRFEHEFNYCKRRRVILANADEASARHQRDELVSRGCEVTVAAGCEALEQILPTSDCHVLVLDATSFGGRGPELVERVNDLAPSMKIVVIASAASQGEAEYRRHRIFYYAVEPFADNEIVEILDALFRPQRRPGTQPEHRKSEVSFVSSVFITNHHGKKVCLFAAGGLLSKDDGVGWHVRRRLIDQLYPIETTLGKGSISQVKILLAASMCDCLLVLLAKDTGRIPGSLLRDAKGEFVSVAGESSDSVMALVVQPVTPESGLAGFDDRTAAALAEHVVDEMTSR